MSKAITTKYLGPTDHKGARFVATDGDGNRVVVPYNYEHQAEGNHIAAATALCEKMKWKGTLVHGGLLKNGRSVGEVFVWYSDRDTVTVQTSQQACGPERQSC